MAKRLLQHGGGGVTLSLTSEGSEPGMADEANKVPKCMPSRIEMMGHSRGQSLLLPAGIATQAIQSWWYGENKHQPLRLMVWTFSFPALWFPAKEISKHLCLTYPLWSPLILIAVCIKVFSSQIFMPFSKHFCRMSLDKSWCSNCTTYSEKKSKITELLARHYGGVLCWCDVFHSSQQTNGTWGTSNKGLSSSILSVQGQNFR